MTQSAKLSPRVLLAFGCVYLFWGSTYVAIRYGVEVISPFLLAAVRFLIAGPLMLGLCAMRGMKIWPSRRDLGMMGAIGVLILGIGNMGVMWAEQYVASGLAALLVAVIPLYVALLETVLPNGEQLRAKGWAGVAIGFGGLLILLSPGLRAGLRGGDKQLVGALATVAAAFVWTCGSILSRRAKVASGAFVAAGWQMLVAGIFNAGLILVTGGSFRVPWPMQAVWSVAWLVTFGSLVGYTAYIYLLDNVPVAKVSTYA